MGKAEGSQDEASRLVATIHCRVKRQKTPNAEESPTGLNHGWVF